MGAWYSIQQIMKDLGWVCKTSTYPLKWLRFSERGGGRTSQKIKALSPMECVIMIADAGMFQHKRAQTNIQQ